MSAAREAGRYTCPPGTGRLPILRRLDPAAE